MRNQLGSHRGYGNAPRRAAVMWAVLAQVLEEARDGTSRISRNTRERLKRAARLREVVTHIFARWNHLASLPRQIPATLRPSRLGGKASVDPRLRSFPKWKAWTVCRERGAEGNIVASCDRHDGPDRAHNHRWLVDRDNVTGLLRRDQTSPF